MTAERPTPEPAPGIRYYDADYAPQGETNIMNHGWGVIDASGEQIGKVDQVYDYQFTIAEGFIIHDLVYAPFSAIDHVDIDGEKVYLNVTQAQIEAMDWEAPSYAAGFGTADNFIAGQDGSSHEGGIVRPAGGMVSPPPRAATPTVTAGAPRHADTAETTPQQPDAVVVEQIVVVETQVTGVPDKPADTRQG